MRRLAAELGVAPNAIYSHVADKATLVDAVLDSLLADVDAAGAGETGPRDGLIHLMRDSRRVLLEHADVLPQLLSRPMRGPQASRLTEVSLQLLAMMGVEGPAAVSATRALLTFTVGSVALDAPRRAEPDPEARWAASEAAFAAGEATSLVARHARTLARPPAEWEFERALGWLLDGIASQS
jgi:AcrR family transcriptional regulator